MKSYKKIVGLKETRKTKICDVTRHVTSRGSESDNLNGSPEKDRQRSNQINFKLSLVKSQFMKHKNCETEHYKDRFVSSMIRIFLLLNAAAKPCPCDVTLHAESYYFVSYSKKGLWRLQ